MFMKLHATFCQYHLSSALMTNGWKKTLRGTGDPTLLQMSMVKYMSNNHQGWFSQLPKVLKYDIPSRDDWVQFQS